MSAHWTEMLEISTMRNVAAGLILLAVLVARALAGAQTASPHPPAAIRRG